MKTSAALGALSTAILATQNDRSQANAFVPGATNQNLNRLQPSVSKDSKLSIAKNPLSSASKSPNTALSAISGAEMQAAATLAGHAALGIGATLSAFRISEKIDAATDNPIARTAGEALAAIPIILTMNLLQQDLSQLQAVSDPLVKFMDAWEAQEALSQASDVVKQTMNLD